MAVGCGAHVPVRSLWGGDAMLSVALPVAVPVPMPEGAKVMECRIRG